MPAADVMASLLEINKKYIFHANGHNNYLLIIYYASKQV